MPKDSSNNFLGYVVLIIIGVIASLFGIYTSKRMEANIEERLPPQIVEVLPSQYPDYDAIKGKNKDDKIKRLNITDHCPEVGCISNKPAQNNCTDIAKTYKVTGKFSRANLFIEAMVDYKRPLTSWDDIYFLMSKNGGHLIPDGNILPTPPGNTSTYLYNLSSLSFYPKISDKMKKVNKVENFDMFSLLEDGSTLRIVATVSSARPGRVFKEVSIYYECTEDSACSIEEIKP